MAESHVKARKVLDLCIERLVAGSCPTLKASNILWIMGVWGTDDGLLATVPLVANYLLACRDLGHELITEDRDVMDRGLVWFAHPNEAILENRDAKLIV